MTATTFSSADVQTRKAWSDRVYYDITTDTEIVSDLISDGILKQENDLSRDAGDEIKTHFLRRLTNKGFLGNTAVTGQESALTYDQFTFNVNQLRNVVKIPTDGTIDAQRVTFDMPEDTYQTLKNWMAEKMTVSALNQLAGYYPTSVSYDGETYTGDERLILSGMNAVSAPSSSNHIFAGGNANDSAVNSDTNATLTFSLIDQCEAAARKNRPYIRPLARRDGVKYKMITHVDGFKQLIQDTSSPIQYRDIYLNKIASGKDDELIGEVIRYSQTEICVTDKIPNGVHSNTAQTNVRRAVFLGQEAGAIGFGKGYEGTAGFKFEDDYVDVNQWHRIAIVGIYGIEKAVYNSVDRGSIVVSHYVA